MSIFTCLSRFFNFFQHYIGRKSLIITKNPRACKLSLKVRYIRGLSEKFVDEGSIRQYAICRTGVRIILTFEFSILCMY